MPESSELERALKILSLDPQRAIAFLNAELSMPNIPTPTLGGEVFWNTLAECEGWKMQQNMITHHARILNSENIRVAWGTVNGMYAAMDRLVASSTRYQPDSTDEWSISVDAAERLKRLKELLDMDAITKEEYDNKKEKLLNKI